MSDLKTKFNELIEKQRALALEFQTTAQSLFKETTKEFFEQNPGVKSITWTQYTPYFNDGDECLFSVHEPSFSNTDDTENINWEDYDGDEEGVWVYSGWGDKPEDVSLENMNEFSKLLQSDEMEDVMEAMFGNHVKVAATRSGFDVTDYDHD
jgi:hypothetical protein